MQEEKPYMSPIKKINHWSKSMKIKLKVNTDGTQHDKPNIELSDKNKSSITFDEYQKEIANRCWTYMFLNWRTKKTYNLVKKLYNKGYTISDTLSFIILTSK